MAAAYAAGAANLPFGVLRGYARHRPRRAHARRADRRARSPARSSPRCRRTGRTSGSSTRSRPTGAGNVQLWGITGVQKEAVLAVGALDRHRRGDRRRARAAAGRRRAARLGDRRGRARARRRAPVVRARLLRPRQRLLRRLGRDQPRPRRVPRLDASEHVLGRRRDEYRASLRRPSATATPPTR